MNKREEELKEAEITINALLSIILAILSAVIAGTSLAPYMNLSAPITPAGGIFLILFAYIMFVIYILCKVVLKSKIWKREL
jgi:hypothetical protein